jgi:myosin heavy subunit
MSRPTSASVRSKSVPRSRNEQQEFDAITWPGWAKEGMAIWIDDRDPSSANPITLEYKKGTILAVHPDTKTVDVLYTGPKGDPSVRCDLVHERNETPIIIEDVVDIEPLNDAEILRNLELRYKANLIYTNIGNTLLVCNPFTREIDSVSKTKEQWDICEAWARQGSTEKKLMPHIWANTANALRQLKKKDKNQSICISGESGAGKTEAARNC